ncbi:MAG TPA: ABC transporter substrate-binding protein [Candidatus Limnocylindria bacterium]|nr:ABC transporter substrate-binding protein [Candidatus Limnocylindria bacterium]
MSRAHPTRPFILALTVLLVLAACGGEGTASPSEEAPGSDSPPGSQAPEGGGTMTIAWEADIQSMDPAIAYDYVSIPAVHMVFESLIGYDDGTTLVPVLAEAMPEVSPDGLTYTFVLRPGVNFVKPDGSVLREMTADDVVYSLNRVLNPNLTPTPSPVASSFFAQIEGGQAVLDGEAHEATGVVAVDDRTVEITILSPNRAFLNVLAMTFGSVVPEGEAGTDTAAFSAAPIGTGPYYMASYTAGQAAHFVRNPHYWGPAPAIAEVEYEVGVDTVTQTQRAQANTLDLMGDSIPTGSLPEVRDDPEYAERLIEEATVAVSYVSIDATIEDPPLNDVRVRQAINHAIDKENLVAVVGGRGEPANCIFPPAISAHDPGCQPYDYNPERARELLAEAGVPDGFATTYYTDTTEDSVALAQAIQQDLAAVGIDVEIVSQEFDVLLETILVQGNAPLLGIAWIQDYPDPSDFYDPILSCAAVGGGFNTSWACSEEADAIAIEALSMTDEAERDEAYREVQRLVMEEALWVPTYFPTVTHLHSDRLEGAYFHPVWSWEIVDYSLSE